MVTEPLILINAFEVPGEEADEFIAAWEKTRDYLAGQPGYVDTALHQAITPGADFLFVNIGRWQSAEAFQNATQNPGFRETAAGLAGYRPHPGLYRVVRT
jgi:heme oxygenase (mycobilin-producing)